jgi:hypothetical protein
MGGILAGFPAKSLEKTAQLLAFYCRFSRQAKGPARS